MTAKPVDWKNIKLRLDSQNKARKGQFSTEKNLELAKNDYQSSHAGNSVTPGCSTLRNRYLSENYKKISSLHDKTPVPASNAYDHYMSNVKSSSNAKKESPRNSMISRKADRFGSNNNTTYNLNTSSMNQNTNNVDLYNTITSKTNQTSGLEFKTINHRGGSNHFLPPGGTNNVDLNNVSITVEVGARIPGAPSPNLESNSIFVKKGDVLGSSNHENTTSALKGRKSNKYLTLGGADSHTGLGRGKDFTRDGKNSDIGRASNHNTSLTSKDINGAWLKNISQLRITNTDRIGTQNSVGLSKYNKLSSVYTKDKENKLDIKKIGDFISRKGSDYKTIDNHKYSMDRQVTGLHGATRDKLFATETTGKPKRDPGETVGDNIKMYFHKFIGNKKSDRNLMTADLKTLLGKTNITVNDKIQNDTEENLTANDPPKPDTSGQGLTENKSHNLIDLGEKKIAMDVSKGSLVQTRKNKIFSQKSSGDVDLGLKFNLDTSKSPVSSTQKINNRAENVTELNNSFKSASLKYKDQ